MTRTWCTDHPADRPAGRQPAAARLPRVLPDVRPIVLPGLLAVLGAALVPGRALAQPAPAAPTVANTAATVQVSGYQVSGNTLLDPRTLDAALLPLLGQRTLDELQRAAAAVQQLYTRAGYGAVVAYVPPQSGSGGTITIQVVEGKISEVRVTGAQQFSADQVRAALPALQVGRTPRLTDIDAQLRIANENPARQVQVLISPGQATGQAAAELRVTEQALQRITLGLDNTGNARTGDWRVSAGWQHANLSGRDDVLVAQLQTSPSQPDRVRVVSGGYRLPLYAQRMALDAFAAWSDVDGGSTPSLAGDISFSGRGRIVGGRAAWYLPRWGDADPRLALGLDRRAYLNRCDIAGLPSGACGPAGESVAVTPLSLELALQAAGEQPWSLQLSAHHNLRLGGAHTDAAAFQAVRADARPAYTAWRVSASTAWALADGWQLRGRVHAQYSADALVPGEQFGLGGAQSLRGYEERELVGDMGLSVSFELGGPPLLGGAAAAGEARAGLLRPHAFIDAGSAANQGDAPCVDVRTRCSAAAVGVGARYVLGPLQARLDVAYALKAAARTQRGDTRAHVALQLGF